MGLGEIILIGIALSMDACGVSISNALAFKNCKRRNFLAMTLLFGIFQGIMPLLGYFAGGFFADFITKWSGLLIFVVLGILGVKMIKDGFCAKEEEISDKNLNFKTIIIQAVATSIDAFAVGITFNASDVNIFTAVSIIAFITAVLCTIAVFIGKKFGYLLKDKAVIFGGILLVVLAVKALF